MKGFTVEAILTKCNSMSDGGLSLGFHTKELDASEKISVMEFHNNAGWLLFQPNEIDLKDLPTQDAELETKSPSQRLRAVMFVWWKQSADSSGTDFEDFYRKKMESIIDQIKGKLD